MCCQHSVVVDPEHQRQGLPARHRPHSLSVSSRWITRAREHEDDDSRYCLCNKVWATELPGTYALCELLGLNLWLCRRRACGCIPAGPWRNGPIPMAVPCPIRLANDLFHGRHECVDGAHPVLVRRAAGDACQRSYTVVDNHPDLRLRS